MKIEHRFTVRASYFSIGSKIQCYWFRGVIVGVNMTDFTQTVRVTAVLKQGAGRSINSIQRIPFGIGEEIADINTTTTTEGRDSICSQLESASESTVPAID